jgi:hypothetical protein
MSEPRLWISAIGWTSRCGEVFSSYAEVCEHNARCERCFFTPSTVETPPAPKPEPSVPLSAIRALVQQWRERVAICRRISVESAARGELVLGRAWAEEADHKQESITDLTALCPAPPEDQT